MGKPYDSIYGDTEYNLYEKANNMCRIEHVDVVKNLNFRKYRGNPIQFTDEPYW